MLLRLTGIVHMTCWLTLCRDSIQPLKEVNQDVVQAPAYITVFTEAKNITV